MCFEVNKEVPLFLLRVIQRFLVLNQDHDLGNLQSAVIRKSLIRNT